MFNHKLPALCLMGCLALPAQAASDSELLLQEIKRLSERVAQLEAERSGAAAVGNNSLAERLAQVESRVGALQKPVERLEAVQGIAFGAGLTMVAQDALGGEVRGSRSQANYRADIEVTLPGGMIGPAQGELFAHLRLGQGKGLSLANPSYTATPNSTVFELHDGDSAALLAQAWYQLTLPLGEAQTGTSARMEFTVGKLDPFIFFDQNAIAGDETTAFLNHAFVHNPMLDSGGDVGVDLHGFTPGIRLAYRQPGLRNDYWQASLGLFGSGPGASFEGSFDKPFVIGQLEAGQELGAGLAGSYRLYAWSNGRATAYDGVTEERHSGWGVSLDQRIAQHASLFARYGQSTQGRVRFDRALTVGAELAGANWGRAHDRLGLAVGWLKTADTYRDADPDGYGPSGTERLAELYYTWRLNEQLELSPDLQWIGRPGGNGAARELTVVGLRAKASF
ncbi:carbohydrate-selective porin OprB [Sulfuritortus calidifontis]|uniref:Carbohydrate-selective porin OprB n=1 Tax=Sulfuritortus calidifontis TaxID=1914471 RepID=A0A4R3JTR4_9PROT|nr:carbohydrate porin [Sulfuritortus calidifontis]TCS70895.1 carbohydrate-selective porin OprB [Sulfuritortus calidifontis]